MEHIKLIKMTQEEFDAECDLAHEAYLLREFSWWPEGFDSDGNPLLLHDFDGRDTYEPEHDRRRLNSQLRRVFNLMRDGQWRSLGTLAAVLSTSESGVSARLRDFRKARFGSHTVERRRVDGGLFEYRLLPNGDLP